MSANEPRTRLFRKHGGWIDFDIGLESTGCACPSCSCPDHYVMYHRHYDKDGELMISGSHGVGATRELAVADMERTIAIWKSFDEPKVSESVPPPPTLPRS